ncbi:MAG: L,D-transpeptidase family protein [Desulfobulbaceae bacterium]|nr:L,D-transpeptidase family protein [Desulfobulbaceae bacterium]
MRLTPFFILISLLLLSLPSLVFSGKKADAVLVDKSDAKLYLMQQGQSYAAYPVTFGANPKGHKQQQGDERTPEGSYLLDYKNANSAYYKSIHISYPNAQDSANARKRGVNPGGAIMIHGQTNGWEWAAPLAQLFNWTNGCIALQNHHMDIVWEAVDPGTPIKIQP